MTECRAESALTLPEQTADHLSLWCAYERANINRALRIVDAVQRRLRCSRADSDLQDAAYSLRRAVDALETSAAP